MTKVCPRCKTLLGEEPKCPTCGFHILSPLEVRRPLRARASSKPASKWQQTPWGKTLIGMLISLGLFYGLMLLSRAVLSATGHDWQSMMKDLSGLMLLQALQLVSLIVGGMLAGAGQRRGTLLGTNVGLYNAIIFLIVWLVLMKNELPPGAFFVLPILQIAFGTVGGFIGTQIWKPILPLADLPDPSQPPEPASPLTSGLSERIPTAPPPIQPGLFSGPISWIRVALGTAVAFGGYVGADKILSFLVDLSEKGPMDTQRQAHFLMFEIIVLSALVGGALAGSGTFNGIKQGLVVGVVSSIMLVVYFVWRGEQPGESAATYAFSIFGFKGTELVHKVIFLILAVLPLGLAGGWFGGQLMPPIVLPPRHRRMLPGVGD